MTQNKPSDSAGMGMAIMAAAMLIAPLMDLFAKLATEYVVPAEVAAGRFLAQSVILIPVVFWAREWARPGRAHLLAGVCAAIAILSINTALAVMPIANAIAIFFVEPLILTVLSAIFLGEKIGWRRISAVAVGLAGAMIVIRPNVAAYGWEALLPLVTAVAFAIYMLVLRVLSPAGGRIVTQFWIGAIACGTLALTLLSGAVAGIGELSPSWPPGEAVVLMIAAGALACVVHQMLAQAMARAEAGALAPLQYLEIVGATVIGWLVFNEFPDGLTLLGASLIITSGVYVFRRERRLARGTT